MEREPTPCHRRRETLKRGLDAAAGLAVVMVAGRAFAQPAAKLSKESVQYTDSGNTGGKDCDDCSQYLQARSADAPATCKIVEGPISPHGHCIAFSPKPR
jgi:hypothetical protein